MKKKKKKKKMMMMIIIIIIFNGLGRLTFSGIDALPTFPGASTISSSSRFVVEDVFRESGVVHSFKMVDPVLCLDLTSCIPVISNIIIIIIIIIYFTANGLSPGGSGYNACT
jgi:hypothetical protein